MASLFFFATKLFWLVTAPDTLWLILLIGAFGLGATRFHCAARRLTGLLLLLAIIVVVTRPAQYVARPLENRFPRPDWPACVHGILMLGGGESPAITAARGVPEVTGGAPRLLAAVELLRRYPEARLIFAGGSGEPLQPEPSEASTVKAALDQIGVDPGRVTFEDRSRNSWENLVNTMALAAPTADQRWVLVTSAMHMPRVVGIARKLGWNLLPWPADYTSLPEGSLRPEGHFAEYLADFSNATHEWLGLAGYWLTGRSSALFPAPAAEPATIRCSGKAELRPLE
ncbi:MAG: YdcF family protein [Aliidongia sp.]